MYRLWEAHLDALGALASTELWRRVVDGFLAFAAPVRVERIVDVSPRSGLLLPFLGDHSDHVVPFDVPGSAANSEGGPAMALDATPTPPAANLVCAALTVPDEGDLDQLTGLLKPGGCVAFLLPALGMDPQEILGDRSLAALPDAARERVQDFFRRISPHGHSDVQVARWFAPTPFIAVRTAPLLGGSLLMAKARRP